MSSLAAKLRTYSALGPANLARAAAYRIALTLRVHPVQQIQATLPASGPFFAAPMDVTALPVPSHWRHEALLFGTHRRPIAWLPPDWSADPLNYTPSEPVQPEGLPNWWTIGDFAGGDIKRVWEYSRFDWALAFAQQARAGHSQALERLELWISDWARRNPAYRGANWKCAQEASIRVMHLALSGLLLGTEARMTDAMHALVDAHVRRILPTLSYARSQDNNHTTSEAAAIFIAGAWYRLAGRPGAGALLRRGAALLERSTLRLFARDGSFSQYSLNYHRVGLDTLSIAEIWRRRAGLLPFSLAWYERARAAADWLCTMIDPASGDAPNLGANDGANLLPLTDAEFRDFRPSAQIASALFRSRRAFAPGSWDDALAWLGLDPGGAAPAVPERAVFSDGGFVVLRHRDAMAMLRYPRFRFRPSQADALHVDLWHEGRNLLRDGGSYSYNGGAEWIDYFGGVESHNTVQFDGAPQMPRLSRFLLGDWLKTESSGTIGDGFAAAYHSRQGWRHHRRIALSENLTVVDTISGFAREATLRWRLAPGSWRLEGETVTNDHHRLSIRSDMPITIRLAEGWESRCYLERTPLAVVEVIATQPGRIVSEYQWTL